MAFNSLAYALLLTFAVAWMAIGPFRALMLIVASLIFYAAAGPFDMLVFVSAVVLNWLIQVTVPADRRRILAAVIVNIGLIGYFKYRNMLLGETSPAGTLVPRILPVQGVFSATDCRTHRAAQSDASADTTNLRRQVAAASAAGLRPRSYRLGSYKKGCAGGQRCSARR